MDSNYRACTIVARNYLAQAQVLVRSCTAQNPTVPFSTLIIDGDEADRALSGVGKVVLPSDLGLDPSTLHSMMVVYDVMEFATALKPALLMWLIRQGAAAAAYFDPDIKVFAALGDVFDDAARHDILLTPHTLDPIPRDGRQLDERVIMHAGIYNLGFIAVGAGGYRFLSWWHQRLRTDAIVDVQNALFTDQRWVDWAPSLFEHKITRDRGLNAAYWNLHEREIALEDGRWYAGEWPLRFYHFSGYDPEKPWLLSKHMGGQPRTLLSEHDGIRQLCDEYARELIECGHPQLRRQPYRLRHLPNGAELDVSLRRVYREVITGRLEVATEPPDPILDSERFVQWMLAPMFEGGYEALSVVEYGIWSTQLEVRQRFPDVLGEHGRGFRQWLSTDPGVRNTLSLLTGAEAPRPSRRRKPPVARREVRGNLGWSVIAYARSELGVGEAGRRIAQAVRLSGLPTETVAVPIGNASRQLHQSTIEVREQASFDNAIICVNADQVVRLDSVLGLGQFGGARIGLWFWELAKFPGHFSGAFDRLHEVWVASEFNRQAIQAASNIPVRTIRLPMDIPLAPTAFTRRSVGLPEDKYVFLTNFDYLSVYRRKNPAGAIRAYVDAFGPDDGAALVVKSINGHLRPQEAERVRYAAGGRPDIVFLDEYVSAATMKAMIELADAYVSLHRSEGYGINIADAMARGTPVIVTAYSGNMDFTTPGTAELIGYDLAEVGPGNEPYDPGAVWADPRLSDASAAMRRLFDDPGHARSLAVRASARIREHFSPERISREMQELLLATSGKEWRS